jgi:DnaJ like chaperone protein
MAYGKWIGAAVGWAAGGILGALAGYCIGALLDDATEGSKETDGSNASGYRGTASDYESSAFGQRPFQEDRNSFLFSMLVLSSYIIKADGRVMHSEMEFVRQFLRDNFGQQAVQEGEDILMKLFEQQKIQGPATFRETIRKSCVQITMHMNEGQRLQLLNYLVIISKVDGAVSAEEVAVLKEVARYLNLSEQDVDSMLNMGTANRDTRSLDDAYKILGVNPDCTDDELKKAYRQMALKHHPDRVATLGEDVKKAAEKKFQEINDAKDRIWKARGL